MNDITIIPSSSTGEPHDTKRKWITIQLTLSRKNYQRVKEQLNELSEQTGIDFPISKFATRTFLHYWKTEFEQARKSFEKYAQPQE